MTEGDGGARNIHASAAVLGERGVLVRGAPGAGKSSLALALVTEARLRGHFARLVADDRTLVRRHGDRLVARPHPALAGLVERRGLGVLPVDHEPACVIVLVVDLVEGKPARMPPLEALRCAVADVALPRLALAAGTPISEAVALVAAALTMSAPSP